MDAGKELAGKHRTTVWELAEISSRVLERYYTTMCRMQMQRSKS